MTSRALYTERTNHKILITGAGLVIVGVLLVWLTEEARRHSGIFLVIRELGALLVPTGLVALAWELFMKRAFLAELVTMVKLAEEVRASGLIGVPTDFYRDIDWTTLLRRAHTLDIFFAYGRTWRGINSLALQDLARRPGACVRIVLPDPTNPGVVAELARRFRTTCEDVKASIEESARDFTRIFTAGSECTATFSLWYLPAAPVFTFYRCDHQAILTLYKHRPGRGDIPIFLLEEGGQFYDFLCKEFDAFVQGPNKLARCGYPVTEIKEAQHA